jgi:hypothetical protein
MLENSMNQTELPEEWDDEKCSGVLAHYEGKTDEEALAEDEAALESTDATVTIVAGCVKTG